MNLEQLILISVRIGFITPFWIIVGCMRFFSELRPSTRVRVLEFVAVVSLGVSISLIAAMAFLSRDTLALELKHAGVGTQFAIGFLFGSYCFTFSWFATALEPGSHALRWAIIVLPTTLASVLFFIIGAEGSFFLFAVGVGIGIACSYAGAWYAAGGEWARGKDVCEEQEISTISNPILSSEVAALIPAHNEEAVIERTLRSLIRILPPENIFCASDASTDRTIAIVERYGARALDIQPNKGKAGALRYALDEFKLCERFRGIMIVDADSEVGPEYLEYALPILNEVGVAVVAVHARSKWTPHTWPRSHFIYTAYRVRFYRILQAVYTYAQSWRWVNVHHIAPGFASLYRAEVMRELEIDAPGLAIEDYNLTFEVHKKKLGRVAYSPRVFAYSQDPLSLRDYIKQIRRWNLGLWQTMWRHRLWEWPSAFSFSVMLLVAEMFLISAVYVLGLPIMLALLIIGLGGPVEVILPGGSEVLMYPGVLLGGYLAIDAFLTVLVALYERKPMLLVYIPVFPILRFIDCTQFFYSFYLTFTRSSSGRWVSPARVVARST